MIYVDDAGIEKGGHKWYHLISDDPNDAELHAFAKKVGLRCWWYQHDHYDVTGGYGGGRFRLGRSAYLNGRQ